jgi:hypothetical protein
MRILPALLLCLAPAALRAQAPATSTVAPTATASSAAADVARLGWLAGCWELRTPTRVTQERWTAPAGGLMLGTSRTVVRGVAREFEFLRLEVREGVVQYVAQPGGRPPTAFAAREVTDSTATFENPAHDFPQRVIYRRTGPDSALGRIEGLRDGQPRAVDFPLRRERCPPAP